VVLAQEGVPELGTKRKTSAAVKFAGPVRRLDQKFMSY
jgi:hypothetical protein